MAMQKILILVVLASVAAAALSVVGLNVVQMAHATSDTTHTCPCGSGNPHGMDPDNPGALLKGNPHDIESGLTNGNPHTKA